MNTEYRTTPAQRAQAARYYAAHREERLARGKEWAARNHDKVLAQARERYRRTDPRRRFAWRANRKVAQYGRPEDILDWATIPEGPWTCVGCGVPCESWDHIVPLVMGGANQAENLMPSCLPCNQNRTARAVQKALPLRGSCRRGHPFDEANTRPAANGRPRRCRACAREYAITSYYRRRAA